MSDELKRTLGPVRSRMRRVRVLEGAVRGLALGAGLALVLGLLRWGTTFEPGRGLMLSVILGGAALGMLRGLLRRQSWAGAASVVDSRFALKDRTLSALHFDAELTLANEGPEGREGAEDPEGPGGPEGRPGRFSATLRALLVQDATQHLGELRPEQAVRVGMPRMLWPACAAALLALFLAGWPPRSSQAVAAPSTASAEVLDQLDEVLEIVDELERQAEEGDSEELEALAREMREMAEGLDEPGVELREALSKLSQMQEELAALQAQFAEGVVDAHLESLGEAMKGSEALEAAGEALEAGDLEEAMDALEKAESQLGQEPRSASQEKADKASALDLQQVSEEMAQDQLEQMSKATEQMAEGMQEQDSQKAREGAKKLGQQMKKHSQAKGMSKTLAAMGQKLGEAKSAMAKAASKKPSNQDSLAEGQAERNSTKPSQNFGMKSHGGLDGAKTELDAQRQFEQLSGALGAGDSEFETMTGPEKEERSRRSVQEIHQDYQKMSEAVLEAENLPLGYRESIRRYFEAIRPTAAELEQVEADGGE